MDNTKKLMDKMKKFVDLVSCHIQTRQTQIDNVVDKILYIYFEQIIVNIDNIKVVNTLNINGYLRSIFIPKEFVVDIDLDMDELNKHEINLLTLRDNLTSRLYNIFDLSFLSVRIKDDKLCICDNGSVIRLDLNSFINVLNNSIKENNDG